MYQNAGEFAWRAGLPAKFGAGGGIVAIVPSEMAIVAWSCSLYTSDAVAFCLRLVSELSWSFLLAI
ncbi:hypothetical protein FG732_26375, partial [Salmonella enterica subsp. enterica serovar London]